MRTFSSVSEADLDVMRERGRQNVGFLPDLNLSYTLTVPIDTAVVFFNTLIENPLVEFAEFTPLPAPDP